MLTACIVHLYGELMFGRLKSRKKKRKKIKKRRHRHTSTSSSSEESAGSDSERETTRKSKKEKEKERVGDFEISVDPAEREGLNVPDESPTKDT